MEQVLPTITWHLFHMLRIQLEKNSWLIMLNSDQDLVAEQPVPSLQILVRHLNRNKIEMANRNNGLVRGMGYAYPSDPFHN